MSASNPSAAPAAHTPGPAELFFADRSFSNESKGREMHAAIVRDGIVLAYIPEFCVTAQAVAPQMVRAFNAHDTLLAALKSMIVLLAGDFDGVPAVETAKSVIATAEGRAS